MAFVRKRGDKFHLCYRDAGGRRVQEPSKARTKSEAQRLADELERREDRIAKGLDDDAPQRMTFGAVSEKYLVDVAPNHESFKMIVSQVKHLTALNDKLLHQVAPADIERLLTSRRDTLAPETREKLRKRVHTIFRYAKERLRVFRGENPAALVPRVKVPRTKPRYLPLESIPRVMMAAGPDRDLLACAFFTGLRKGELCGLKPEDVELRQRVIRVRRSYMKATKSGRERIVLIPDELLPYMEHALEQAEENEDAWLFPDAEGHMRTLHWDAADLFRRCLKTAGLISGYRHMCRRRGCGYREERKDDAVSRCPDCDFLLWVDAIPQDFTFKHTRSTWGTHAYAATGDIRFVQHGLGHQDVSTTEIHYSHARTDHLLAQANKVRFLVRELPHGNDKAEQSTTNSDNRNQMKAEGKQ